MIKVLLVEDKEIFYVFLRMIGFDAEVVWVDNGEKAVEQIEAGHTYDAIIMNIEMPIMNGIRATELIRKLGYKGPIMGWTAHCREFKERECLQAGMDIFVERWGKRLGVDEITSYLQAKDILQ